uniref:Putative Glycosyl transferase family 2 n=1 Tax=mine drainage metagenome TaxID=410659 RepID=E6Q133_9ZZZZ
MLGAVAPSEMIATLSWLLGTALAFAFGGAVMTISNERYFRRLSPQAGTPGAIDLYIAMRDEASNARACLASFLAQPELRRAIVIDDGSSDESAAILAQIACEDERVLLLSVPEDAPAQRSPKARALAAAIAAAPIEAPFALFADADVRALPGALGATLAARAALDVGAVTGFPRIRVRDFWAAGCALLPRMLLLEAFPMRAASGTDPRFAAGNGQWFLVERDAYVRSGGHAAIVGLVEDIALASALKRSGTRVACVDARDCVVVEGYDGLRASLDGLGRSLLGQVGILGSLLYATTYLLRAVLPIAAVVAWLHLFSTGSGAWFETTFLLTLGAAAPTLAWRSAAAAVERPRGMPQPPAAPFAVALGLSAFCSGIRGGLRWRGRRIGRANPRPL